MLENKLEFDFEKLKVYQKSLDFIDKIFNIYRKLPQGFKYSIGSNLLRACLSIANNLAEGSGKKSMKDKLRYYSTSLDSTRECVSVFNVLKRQSLLEEGDYRDLRIEAKEITSMLFGLINSV